MLISLKYWSLLRTLGSASKIIISLEKASVTRAETARLIRKKNHDVFQSSFLSESPMFDCYISQFVSEGLIAMRVAKEPSSGLFYPIVAPEWFSKNLSDSMGDVCNCFEGVPGDVGAEFDCIQIVDLEVDSRKQEGVD